MPKWDGQRRAGVILHPTSLPGPYGIGELGGEARAFVDWLVTSGMTCWQMLPLGPPVGWGDDGCGQRRRMIPISMNEGEAAESSPSMPLEGLLTSMPD